MRQLMAKKNRTNDLETSLEAVRQINWLDGVHQLPGNVDKKLLDQCSELIQEFIENDRSFPTKIVKSQSQVSKRKNLGSKVKKTKIKKPTNKRTKPTQHSKKIKSKVKRLKNTAQPFNYANLSSTNAYPCYPSAFPCFRSCGPIKCPNNRLPMPRDLWYRIVYSQVLEKQLGSGEAFTTPRQSDSRFPSSSKRKYAKDERIPDKSSYSYSQTTDSTSSRSLRQQTTNAAFSLTSTRLIKLDVSRTVNDRAHQSGLDICEIDSVTNRQTVPSKLNEHFPMENLEYVTETLPLETEEKHPQSILPHPKLDPEANLETPVWSMQSPKKVLFTQSAHGELLNRPKVYRGLSADAKLDRKISLNILVFAEQRNSLLKGSGSIPSARSPSMISTHPSIIQEDIPSPVQLPQSSTSIQQTLGQTPREDFPIVSDHPIMNQLFEYYGLEDIPRLQLIKRLNARLQHIRQTLKQMSTNDIEIKLGYKRDALVKKRQTPVQSLTKDERIAMAELELNVHEYVKALDGSSKCSPLDNHNELEVEHVLSTSPVLSFNDPMVPSVKNIVPSESSIAPSISTYNTIRPSAISQSTALLSVTTQFSDKTNTSKSWNHPLLPNLMKMFEQLSPLHRNQIRKQLVRRHEHICKKAKELDQSQLQTQIDSKTKAMAQTRKLLQPNENERLRLAELEICLFELEKELRQRDSFG